MRNKYFAAASNETQLRTAELLCKSLLNRRLTAGRSLFHLCNRHLGVAKASLLVLLPVMNLLRNPRAII